MQADEERHLGNKNDLKILLEQIIDLEDLVQDEKYETDKNKKKDATPVEEELTDNEKQLNKFRDKAEDLQHRIKTYDFLK